jgi:hypothetical protein
LSTATGCWIFIAGQVGAPLLLDKGSVTFEQEVRTTLERIRGLGRMAGPSKGAAGKPFGEEIYAAIQEPDGEITEVSYVFRGQAPTRRRFPR